MRREVTAEEMLLRMADLCARSEQCSFDIRRKLKLKGLSYSDIEKILQQLEKRSFIDDSRYARSFARDKVRFSAWGKLKIRASLAAKHIAAEHIADALELIEESDYEDALLRSVKAKAKSLDINDYEDRRKLLRHMLSRGFSMQDSVNAIKRIIKQNEMD